MIFNFFWSLFHVIMKFQFGWLNLTLCVCLCIKQATVASGVDVDKLDSVSEGKLKEKLSETKIGKAGRHSTSKLDEVCEYENL